MPETPTVEAFIAGPEPENGTVLVVSTSDDWRIYVRDDAMAETWDNPDPDARWFDAYDPGAGATTLAEWLGRGDVGGVHAVGELLAGQ